MTRNRYPLVHQRHFAHATRDTGYRSTSAAVAELVDNSIQAGASSVQIVVQETGAGPRPGIRIAVWDDGSGMNAAELQQALQFGGSNRFNDRSGLGRFGMGLPNASVSQARRVEVFTWRSRRRVWLSYLDHDEIAAGRSQSIPAPKEVRDLPDWAPTRGPAGTLVVWTKCDRLDNRKLSTITAKLDRELGRMFRHLLQAGLRIAVNGRPVRVIDPLFRLPGAEVRGAVDYLEPLRYRIKVPGPSRRTAQVTARFTKLPVKEWAALPPDEKRRMGIVGGAGVFVLRAGREIAHGWYFMRGKARQNYDDWWRCEVEFPPSLDELFGVTHSKQGIWPSQELNAILGPEISQIARKLSQEVRAAFAGKASGPRNAAAVRANGRDWRLPRLPLEARRGPGVSQLMYDVQVKRSARPEFFEWNRENGKLSLTLNENHAFYSGFLSRMDRHGLDWARRDLETVLIAYARAAEMGGLETQSFRATWSDVLAAFIEA